MCACVLHSYHLGLVHSTSQVGVIPFPVLSFQKDTEIARDFELETDHVHLFSGKRIL